MPGVDQLELKAEIGLILNRWPAVGLAVGVVRTGVLSSSTDMGSPTSRRTHPVTEDTVFGMHRPFGGEAGQ